MTLMVWGDESSPWFDKCEREWQIGHFYKADPAYGEGVAKRLNIAIDDIATAQAAE